MKTVLGMPGNLTSLRVVPWRGMPAKQDSRGEEEGGALPLGGSPDDSPSDLKSCNRLFPGEKGRNCQGI